MRWFSLLAIFYFFFSAVAFADPVTLRTRVEANGPAVTMLSMAVIAASASAAGLEFTPPLGVNSIQIVRPGGMRATLAPAGGSVSDAAIRRGETVTLTYAVPGISLSMRARAMEDGAIGDSITFLNTSSNRQIDAVVTAPGQAQAAQ